MRCLKLHIVSLAFLAVACSPASLPPKEYAKWVLENEANLSSCNTFDQLTYCVAYKPVEMMIMQEAKSTDLTESQLKMGREKFGSGYYLTLCVAVDGSGLEPMRYAISSDEDYYARSRYAQTLMKNDFQLIAGSDTLPCAMFHFEPSYQLKPSNTFLLAFERGKETCEHLTLIYDDKLWGNGLMKLRIDNLTQIPELKLN